MPTGMTNSTNFCHYVIQRIQFNQFTENVGETANVWTGSVDIQLINEDILAET